MYNCLQNRLHSVLYNYTSKNKKYMNTTTKKITRTTIKNFVAREAKNQNLYINIKSSFSGMTDCVEDVRTGFTKAVSINHSEQYNLGFNGIWLVGSNRDYFQPYSDENYIGYEISNCCGSFIIAMHR